MKLSIYFRRNLRLILLKAMNLLRIGFVLVFIAFCFSQVFTNFLSRTWGHLIDYTSLLGWQFRTLELLGAEYVPHSDIVQAIDIQEGAPLLRLDLRRAHSNINSLPWIQKCLLRRKLPDTLQLEIVEKVPIALLRKDDATYLLDETGAIIDGANTSGFRHLLHVAGDGAQEVVGDLLRDIHINKLLASKILIALRCERRRWDLYLEGQILVKMPEVEFAKAWAYLDKMYRENNLLGKNYEVIDLRDPQKCYITHSDSVPT